MAIKFNDPEEFSGKRVSDKVIEVAGKGDFSLEWLLADRLKERNLTANKLSKITGIRSTTLYSYMNNTFKGYNINTAHLFAIMVALRIADVSELITVNSSRSTKVMYNKQSRDWVEHGLPPKDVLAALQ